MVGGCLFVGAFHYFVRPHMFTIAFLGWTMMCIVDYERGRCAELAAGGADPAVRPVDEPARRRARRDDDARAGGRGVGGAVPGRERSRTCKSTRSDCHRPADSTLAASPIRTGAPRSCSVGIVVACVLTPFVNPFGMEMIRTWRRIVGSKVLPEVVNEHMPLDPTSPLGLAVDRPRRRSTSCCSPGTLPKRPRVSWLIPLVWFVLSFKGIRQGPLFAITAAVAIADLWPHTVWHRLLVKHGDGSLATETRRPEPRGRVVVGDRARVSPCCVALALQVKRTRSRSSATAGHGSTRTSSRPT